MKKLRYIIEAIFVSFMYLLFSLMPFKMASWLGGAIMSMIGSYLQSSKIAKINLQNSFPYFSDEEIKINIQKMWNNLGRTIGEFPHIAKMSKDKFNKFVLVEGLENVKEDYIKNGCFFVSGHFANWEIAPKAAYILGFPLHLIYRRANNFWLDRLINYNRSFYMSGKSAKGKIGARGIIAAIANHESIAILVDQKMNDGIKVPFLGQGAMTAPAIANLALRHNYPIIPAQVIRTKTCHFKVKIHPPLELKKIDNNKENIFNIMLIINQMLEIWIKENPSQWLWIHRRWGK